MFELQKALYYRELYMFTMKNEIKEKIFKKHLLSRKSSWRQDVRKWHKAMSGEVQTGY